MPSRWTSTPSSAEDDGNRFLSPFSISTALAMTYAGAQDETALQIAKALRFKLPPSQLHPAFHKLIAELHGRNATPGRPGPARRRPALYGQRPLDSSRRAHPSRLPEANRDQLPGGALSPVDFHHAPLDARRTINAWVEEQTKGKIKDSAQIDAY